MQLKRCAHKNCNALGVGPSAQRLWPMSGRLWCKDHWPEALQWEETRTHIIDGLRHYEAQDRQLQFYRRYGYKSVLEPELDWTGYIHECCELATWGLTHDDRRTFVHYFARALWARDLERL